jgi:hypothetical protein
VSLLRRLFGRIDVVLTGRPPHVIERQFGWLRGMGFEIQESGSRWMELYATYASDKVLVRVLEEYHYEFVGVWLARARAVEGGGVGPDVSLEQLLASRAPAVDWDPNYGASVRGAGEAKLAEAARLLRETCVDILRGDNLDELDLAPLSRASRPPGGRV